MAKKKVSARVDQFKFWALFGARYDETTMPSVSELEANGYCVTLGGLVLTVEAYEALCALFGGVE